MSALSPIQKYFCHFYEWVYFWCYERLVLHSYLFATLLYRTKMRVELQFHALNKSSRRVFCRIRLRVSVLVRCWYIRTYVSTLGYIMDVKGIHAIHLDRSPLVLFVACSCESPNRRSPKKFLLLLCPICWKRQGTSDWPLFRMSAIC